MILHIDMDAFYASVEVLDNPELKGKPVIVGGVSGRGVVAAASYEARKFGIHSAMPMFQAFEKCPGALVVRPRRSRYKEVSRQVMAILRCFSPLVEQVSIDEAYADVSGCRRLFGSPEEIARRIKSRIVRETGLTCSAGVAPVKFLAKIASDMDKPDGLTVIAPDEVGDFVQRLPIKKTPGVGARTAAELENLGIATLGDVSAFPQRVLVGKLGKFGRRLKELSHGIDRSKVTPCSPAKSVSAEETFPYDTANCRVLKEYLLRQAQEVGRQLRKEGVKARTVSIKIKTSDFKQLTRSRTLNSSTCSAQTLYKEACRLLDALSFSRKLRLIGLCASGLTCEKRPVQLELFGAPNSEDESWEKVDRAVDAIADRFGKGLVGRGVPGEF